MKSVRGGGGFSSGHKWGILGGRQGKYLEPIKDKIEKGLFREVALESLAEYLAQSGLLCLVFGSDRVGKNR